MASNVKLTKAHGYILRFIEDQVGRSCRLNWLPDDIDFLAYRDCRDQRLVKEQLGRDGFKIVRLTRAGLEALREVERR